MFITLKLLSINVRIIFPCAIRNIYLHMLKFLIDIWTETVKIFLYEKNFFEYFEFECTLPVMVISKITGEIIAN